MSNILNTDKAALIRNVSLCALAGAMLVSFSGVATAQQSLPSTPEMSPNPDTAAVGAAIVVSGSRIDRPGFQAPTPTTVVGPAELRQGAPANIAATLDDLPQFRPTNSGTTNQGNTNAGSATADLRGLGDTRTLVLLNGRRFVGVSDLNSIPQSLVKRVDIVTGGASAAWGSGAVAGVVNIILDDNLKGLTVGAQNGISSRGDGEQFRFTGSYGTSFAGGRGHFMIGAEYFDDKGIIPATSRPNVGGWSLLANPNYTPTNGQHQYFLSPNVGSATTSLGGLIQNGVLQGQTFNSNGTLRPFGYGNPIVGSKMVGGEGYTFDDYRALSTPVERINTYARASFDVSPSLKIWAEGGYSRVSGDYLLGADSASVTITSDNAYLPAAVRSALVSAGQTSFTLGRVLLDSFPWEFRYRRETTQGAIGADGTFGKWRYSAYYSHGEVDDHQTLPGLRVGPNFANAVDAVISPTTGNPICRIALSNPATGCVPINLFGSGNVSQAARAYAGSDGTQFVKTTLDVGGASLRGEPFSTWAGPVSVAVGGEARREYVNQTADPHSTAGDFAVLSFSPPIRGGFSVKEGFAEAVIPLARDLPLLKDLNLNGAARVSDYSTSGTTWSWKIGATDKINDNLLLRVVRSRDIRSASLDELYESRTINMSNIADPVTGTTPLVTAIGGGNVQLKPEIANTFTAGGVLTFPSLPGFGLSADFYHISIKNVITQLESQDIVDRCASGNQALCSDVTRDANGNITGIFSGYINLAQYITDGIDFEASYVLPLNKIGIHSNGSLRFRGFVNYVGELVSNDGITRINGVGNVGNSSTFGVPRWRGNGSVTYQKDDFNLNVRVRYIGGGEYNPALDIANNAVSSRTYVDLGIDKKISNGHGKSIDIFANMNNTFDRQPPIASLRNPNYDLIGRYITIGVQVKM